MATVLIDPMWPRLPAAAALKFATPIKGAAASSLAVAADHLAGWRARRAVHRVIDHDTSSTPIEVQTPTGVSATHRVWWTSSSLAEYVAVVLDYQAWYASASGQNPIIDADIYVKGGARIDSPAGEGSSAMRWQYTDRTLPSWRGEVAGLPLFFDNRIYPILSTSTGAPSPSGIDLAPTYPSPPRPFDLDGNGGSDIELRISTSDVRLIAVDVWEMYTPTMEQQ